MSGVIFGTNGQIQDEPLRQSHSLGFKAWALISALLLCSSLVSITSTLSEPAGGRVAQDWEVVLGSLSSASVLAFLAPAFFEAYSRFPPRRNRILTFVGLQVVLLMLFALTHVLGMVAIRKLGYFLAGHAYDFTGGRPFTVFVYELRKDAFTYLTFLLFYSVCFSREGKQRQAVETERPTIEIKSGGRRLYLPPASILYVQSAGNYVELQTVDRSFLLRDTLASYEAKLSAFGFVRIHRATLVNASQMAETHGDGFGGLKIRMSNGAMLSASRRHKAKLLNAGADARGLNSAQPDPIRNH